MKKIFTLVLSFTMVGAIMAQTISPKVAAKKAAGVFANASAARGQEYSASTATVEPQMAYISIFDGDTCFYVFNNPEGGYAIIGGDRASREILAIVDNGSFDMNTLPAVVKAWLFQYSHDISVNKKAGIVSADITPAGSQSVEPLCPATWDQSAPYNNTCPILPTDLYDVDEGDHAATGCVATGAAQALFTLYKQGKPVPAHITEDIKNKVLNFIDDEDNVLGNTPAQSFLTSEEIQWSKMKNKYVETDNGYEVAELMRLMGLICDMGYGEESGSDGSLLQAGLVKYLGMQAQYIQHAEIADHEWETMVYGELEANRPVIYEGLGKDGNGGHCFIVDGYKADGNLFHVNWGWGSLADGYYALSSASDQKDGKPGIGSWMYPEDKGIGAGSSGSYAYDNDMVINLIYNGSDPAPTPTGVADVLSSKQMEDKFISNTHGLVIVKNGKQYNAAGQIVK